MSNLTLGSIIYNKSYHADNFDRFRVLDEKIINNWIGVLKNEYESSECSSNILIDIGAGTGRFSIPFSKYQNWRVVAMDKSIEMLNNLKNKDNCNNIELFNSDVECFSYHKGIAIAFFSEMLHLLNNLNTSLKNVYKNLDCGGFCCIRTVSHSQLANVEWIHFFEGALKIEQNRTYDVPEIIDTLTKVGFSDISVRNIDESCLFESSFYKSMLLNKVYSLLHIIDEETFKRGYNKVLEYCEMKQLCKHTMELTCIIAKKS